jgi:hypothetical protein
VTSALVGNNMRGRIKEKKKEGTRRSKIKYEVDAEEYN